MKVKTRLQERPLQEIATMTEGTYYPAHTKPLPLGRLFRERIESRPVREESEHTLPQYRQRYGWFLGGALLLLTLSIVPSGASGGLGRWLRAAIMTAALRRLG